MTKRQIKILMPWLKGVIGVSVAVMLVYGCSQLDTRTSLERFEHGDQAAARVQRDKASQCVIHIELRVRSSDQPIAFDAVDGGCSWLLVKPIPDNMKSK